jgi:hypothetical protein
MKSIKLSLVILLSVSALIFGQAPSPYSSIGFGLLNEVKNTRSLGLSMEGVTFNDPDFLNQANPAGLSRIELTKVEAYANLNGMFVSDASAKKYFSYGELGGFDFAFPVSRANGIAALIGLAPYSTARFDLKGEDNSNPVFNTVTSEINLRGGLSDFHISTSYILPYNFRIGLTYHYLFGDTHIDSKLTFGNSDFITSQYTSSYEDHGSYLTFGLISPDYKFAGIEKIRFGMTFDTRMFIETDSFLTRVSSAVYDTLTSGGGSTKVPLKLVLGVSAVVANNTTALLEYAIQDWSTAEGFRIYNGEMRKYQRISAGFEYRPMKDVEYDYTKVVWRGGLCYEQLPVQPAGTGLNQFTISAGVSLPIAYQNHVDIGLAYGSRGTTDNGLFKENFIRMSLGISLGEMWFVQQER